MTKLSHQPVRDTVAKLTTMISAKGMRLFAVIDQASRYSYGEATGITKPSATTAPASASPSWARS